MSDLLKYDLLGASEAIKSKEISSVELTNAYIEAIEKTSSLGAYLEIVKDKEEINEPSRLAITFCNSKSDYTQAKKALDAILLALGLKPEYSSAEHPSFIPGRVARVSVNNKKVAYIGEVSPEVITNFTLDTPVSAIELNLTDIYEILNN